MLPPSTRQACSPGIRTSMSPCPAQRHSPGVRARCERGRARGALSSLLRTGSWHGSTPCSSTMMRSGAACGMRPSGKQVRPISTLPVAFPDGVNLQCKLARAAARRCRRGFPPADCERREAVHVRAASDTAAGPATRGGSSGSGWQRRDPSGANSQKYSAY